MKKQYKQIYKSWWQDWIILYHDGVEVSKKIVTSDELYDEIDKLHDEGYERGYYADEVEEMKRRYEYVLSNKINLKE